LINSADTDRQVALRRPQLIYLFDDYSLDTDRRELRRGVDLVALEPQVFDLLQHLVVNRDRVVSSADLAATVWHGRTVSASTVGSRIAAVRRAIGDSGDEQRLILTLPRKGHRFVGEVRETHDRQVAKPVSQSDVNRSVTDSSSMQAVTFCKTKNGINLAIAAVGVGPVLVRTTHWLSHIEYDWQNPITAPFLHSLAAHSRFIRYDGRGVGLSDRNVPEISFATFQDDLEAVVDSLRLDRFALLGTSQGAAIAIAYAARHPKRVSKLILHGSYALGRNKRGAAGDAEEAKTMIAMMRRGWGDEHSAFMNAFGTLFLPNGTPEQIKAYADLQCMATSAETAVKIRLIHDETDIRDILPKVKSPTIVFHSRHDNVVPFEQGRLVAASIPSAKFIPLESRDHILLVGEPAFAKFIDCVNTFLADGD
jgi:pimeloyl-ACP methyl ester carboxylesterase/DNA-binding winged helix-turn-helix (wHTH) protein